jgi:uncharacterized membrane protein
MTLYFSNHHTSPVSIAIVFYSPSLCSTKGNWEKAGWFNVQPNTSMWVHNGNVGSINRFWYFYAVATDGKYWSGNALITSVQRPNFDACINDVGTVNIGFIMFDVDQKLIIQRTCISIKTTTRYRLSRKG